MDEMHDGKITHFLFFFHYLATCGSSIEDDDDDGDLVLEELKAW